MPTSKLPNNLVMVQRALFNLAERMPGLIFCNARPEQRTVGEPAASFTPWEDAFMITDEICHFLKSLPNNSKIALHFQGYGKETGTAIVEVQEIYWCHNEDYPRLDFKHPEGFDELISSHFWGAFILAVAYVKQDSECFYKKDKYGKEFVALKDKFITLFEYPVEYNVIMVTKMDGDKIVNTIPIGLQKIEGAKPKVDSWLQLTFRYFYSYIGTVNLKIIRVDDPGKTIFIAAPNETSSSLIKTYCTKQLISV